VVASEVVVKNDAITEGGQAYIVGEFAAGEIAAVRLTSPCNGTIVAVQILWLEGSPGHGPILHDAVYIWDGPNFPVPSTVLAFLEAPLLTPGFMNEFRYLDEANSIPISVPVTTGQQFYLGLKFYEPTDVLHGGPSVVRDLNGCQTGKNALYAIPPSSWFNSCSLGIAGDFCIRAVVECPDVTGACCLTSGSCTVVSSSQCATLGGTYQGNNTTCAQVNCPQPLGACCFESTGGCVSLSQANCAGAGGSWGGAGTNCITYVCFPEGACCLPDGSCLEAVSPDDCGNQGGTFQGNNSNCSGVSCPLPEGACCFASGFCLELTEAACAQTGATWKGGGTDCSDTDANQIADACEAAPGACLGDCNCDGVIDFRDINRFVGVLAGQTPCAPDNFDLNIDGLISFKDINPFVLKLSSGSLPIGCD
jgi:hypothetical protein